MTNLIERLRETASKGVSVWGDLQMEAADTIEALFNRNRRLVVESGEYCAKVSRGMSDTIRLMAERDALKAELNATEVLLEECKMDWSGDVTQIKAEHKHEVDTLRQQLAEAQRNAERYQWLREYLPSTDMSVDDDLVAALNPQDVDAAIDAAMKGTA